MNFYTILTAIGKAKLANAQVQGTAVNLTQMAVGDGNGAYYEPTESLTALVHETWRGNINRIITDETNPNWIVIEVVIPTTAGGFTVREAGVFDEDGDMIAVGKYPETYKPTLAEGAGKDLYVRMILEVTNVSTVTLKIDPAVVLASRAYVDQEIVTVQQQITSHTGNAGIHVTRDGEGNLTENITGNAATATLAEATKGDMRFQVSGTWSAPTTTIAANGELVLSSFTTTIPAGKSLILKMARFIIEVSGGVGFQYIKMTVGCWIAGSYDGNKWISDVRGGEYSPNHILYTNSSDSPANYYLRVSAFNTDSNSYDIILPTSWWFDIAIE